MTTQIVISVVALVTALVTAGFTGLVQSRARRAEQERQRLTTLDRYREPLAQSVFHLQSRLWNIARKGHGYREAYARRRSTDHDEDVLRQRHAVTSTLWLIGEYLGWIEILRREVQFLHSFERRDPLKIGDAVAAVTAVFASDDHRLGDELKVFRSHQRAIGELMMIRMIDGNGVERTGCMGFADFTTRLAEEPFARWFRSLEQDVERLPFAFAEGQSPGRVTSLQHALVDLLDRLDDSKDRFPSTLRTKL